MANSPERLYLVDGMSQVYRAYYAIRGLSTSKGLATNAAYGFTMMLRKLMTAERPQFLAVVLDSPEPTFRHVAYPEYKATRGLMPDDLGMQIPYILRVCEALRIPVVRQGGVEADDLIGTLAQRAEKAGIDTVIVTQDKDLCQLVTERITILREERNGSATRIDVAGVEARMGVPPSLVVDLLGIQGDTSDNIPGAPGIGEKGALQILLEFGSIEAALAGWESVKRKTYRESLRDNAAIIRTSRELARIKVDCDIDLDLADLRMREPDNAAACALFTELEFTTLAREFAAPVSADAPRVEHVAPARSYSRVSMAADVERLAERLFSAGRFSISTTDALDGTLAGIAIATEPGTAVYVDLNGCDRPVAAFASLVDVLGNGLVDKIAHDAKHVLHRLNRHLERIDERRAARVAMASSKCGGGSFPWEGGVRVEPISEDTMLAAYLLDANRSKYVLADLVREELELTIEDEVAGFEASEGRALQEADFTLALAGVYRSKIDSRGLQTVYDTIELPLIDLLFDMERTGLLVDRASLAEVARYMDGEIARLAALIYKLCECEFNINSPTQLSDVFEKLNFPMKRRTATGKISTSRDVLDELAAEFEVARLVIEYRELVKLKGTYVEALPALIDPATGRLHTSLNQAVAATGRLSSSNPNVQNIPVRTEAGRAIRRAFVAPPGCALISADYSQIELRILAHIADDAEMKRAFATGEDIHDTTSRAVFGATSAAEMKEKRRLAKIVNFAIAYSVGAFGLAQRTGLTRKAAKETIDNYFTTFSGVRKYMDDTPLVAREKGEVRTLLGRLRRIPDIDNKNRNLRAAAEREAINMPIQGTAADVMKLAMLRVHAALRRSDLHGRIVLQVHDELLVEAPEAELEVTCDLLKREMEAVYTLDVPLLVEVGHGSNWMAAK